MAARARGGWYCTECGAVAPRWIGRCPECGSFGTYVEQSGTALSGASSSEVPVELVSLSEAVAHEPQRILTQIAELDRVLGGGLVPGSLVLLGGAPGVGKSTLLLQASSSLATSGNKVLYICGEESPSQVGLRARRIGIAADNLVLSSTASGVGIEQAVNEVKPSVLVVDSIQTVSEPELTGGPGSVSQVRAATARLMKIAKQLGCVVLVVGHVTKDGALAGPRILEHMVDTVLYFEGDNEGVVRIVRAVKNRFGSTDEIGVFEMSEDGLQSVQSPSKTFIDDRDGHIPGSVFFVAMEGSRPLVVEIQALVTKSYAPLPRRLANGIDTNRLLQVIAVLERRANVSFSGLDVLVSVAGGIRITDPALDLPLALALISAAKEKAYEREVVAFGEIALTGHIRPAARSQLRINEAGTMGEVSVVSSDRYSSVEQLCGLG